MPKSQKIDSYIAGAQPFSKPILKRLRTIIHRTCPKVEEDIKWGKPFYLYQGRVLCATMSFKRHCALVFWKSALIKKKMGKKAVEDLKRARRIYTLADLPREADLRAYIQLAMHFNEPTTKLPPRAKRTAPVVVPKDLAAALRANPRARRHFTEFSPTKKKDYVYWIIGAKTEETRERRLETAIEWIAQGKPRHWKYEAKVKKG